MSDLVVIVTVLGASALAITLLVALNAFMGGWVPARLSDEASIGERICVDVLGFQPGTRRVLDAERMAGLVFEASDARLGLAVCRGDKITVRALLPADIRGVAATGSELVITLDDFTLPQATLRLKVPQLAQRWLQDIERFGAAASAGTSDAEPA